MRRLILTVFAAIVIFVFVAGTILHFMPEPTGASDYLIAGSIATLVALLAMFLGFVIRQGKLREVFFKKRPKQTDEP